MAARGRAQGLNGYYENALAVPGATPPHGCATLGSCGGACGHRQGRPPSQWHPRRQRQGQRGHGDIGHKKGHRQRQRTRLPQFGEPGQMAAQGIDAKILIAQQPQRRPDKDRKDDEKGGFFHDCSFVGRGGQFVLSSDFVTGTAKPRGGRGPCLRVKASKGCDRQPFGRHGSRRLRNDRSDRKQRQIAAPRVPTRGTGHDQEPAMINPARPRRSFAPGWTDRPRPDRAAARSGPAAVHSRHG